MKKKENERPGLIRRVVRFLFVGMWESAYKRKKRRGLYHYDTFTSPPSRASRRAYYSRYHWIRRRKKETERQ